MKARRKKRDILEALDVLLNAESVGEDGSVRTGAENIALAMYLGALDGNAKLIQEILDRKYGKAEQKMSFDTPPVIAVPRMTEEDVKAALKARIDERKATADKPAD